MELKQIDVSKPLAAYDEVLAKAKNQGREPNTADRMLAMRAAILAYEADNSNVLPPTRGTDSQLDADSVAEWMPVYSAGLVKVGDKLRFTIGDKTYNERAKVILNEGDQAKEEVIYNKGKNFYFITSMVVSGKSNHKNVEVLTRRFRAQGGDTKDPGK